MAETVAIRQLFSALDSKTEARYFPNVPSSGQSMHLKSKVESLSFPSDLDVLATKIFRSTFSKNFTVLLHGCSRVCVVLL